MTVPHVLLLTGRLLLAVVFILAGVTKLLDRQGSRRALAGFGVPDAVANPSATALPLVELAVALSLLPEASARYGAVAALALLVLFLAGIVNSLIRGRRPDCHCFGQLHSEPVGMQTLARNAILAVIAAFVAVAGWQNSGPSAVAWLVPLTSAERAVLVIGTLGLGLLALQSVLLIRLARQNERVLSHLISSATVPVTNAIPPAIGTIPAVAGLPVGTPATPFALPTLHGDTVTLDALRASNKPVVLIFSDPECGPCNALLPEIGRWEQEMGNSLTLAVISRGAPEANRVKASEHGLQRVLLQHDREVAEAYALVGTPTAVVVGHDGTIGSLLAQGADEIRRLIGQLATSSGMPQPSIPAPSMPTNGTHASGTDGTVEATIRVGDLAPDFTLPDLDGTPVALNHYRGRPTLVLFWNPGCGYCAQMLGDLAAWEARPLTERAQLLVISSDTEEDNRAMGMLSTIVRDPDLAVSMRYGVQGTPSAALVDAEGRLVAPVAIGATEILALVGQPALPHDGMRDTITSGAFLPMPISALPSDAKPLQESCVQDELQDDGSMVLHNGCQQQILTLNPTAALVWACCDGDHDIEGIIAEMRDIFPDAPAIEQDVHGFLQSLREHWMITDARQ